MADPEKTQAIFFQKLNQICKKLKNFLTENQFFLNLFRFVFKISENIAPKLNIFTKLKQIFKKLKEFLDKVKEFSKKLKLLPTLVG